MFFPFINMFSRFKKCSCFKKLSKFVLCFKIYSQDSKNVRAFKNCSRFQICSPFQNLFSRFKKCSCFKKLSKFVFCFKICSQDSKNVRAFKNCSCFQICSHFKICSQDSKKCLHFKKLFALPNLLSISSLFSRFKNFLSIRKMFREFYKIS